MNISGLSGLIGSSSQSQNLQKNNAKLQAAIASLVSGSRSNIDNVAEVSIATQLQSEVSSLKSVSGNIAQASSLAQVADGGAEQIQDVVEKLQSLAQQASSPTLSDANRKQINDQFQQLAKSLGDITDSTTFNGVKLLDGSVTGKGALSLGQVLFGKDEGGDKLSIDSLSKDTLFDGKSLNLLTQADASDAVSVLKNALDDVTKVRSDIASFAQTLDYAGANIDSAVQNQAAASAILQDTDFAEESSVLSLLNIQRNASLAIQAQGKNLTPNLLNKLLS